MKRVTIFLMLSFLVSICSISLAQNSHTVYIHATVIDVETGKLLKDYTVEVAGKEIASVQPSQKSHFSKTTTIVDIKGKFIIPGLWDMHVHTDGMPDFEHTGLLLFIANGITGIREMGSENEQWKRWRSMPDTILTPRIFAAGKILDGPREGDSAFHERISVKNATDAKHAVDSVAGMGADFVKVHEWIPVDAYKAILEEAKLRHLPVAGHVPVAIDARTASAAGQKSIEHLGNSQGGFLLECSTKEDGLRKERLVRAQTPTNAAIFARSLKAEQLNEQVNYFDSSKAIALAQLFSKNHTWQVPTLVVLKYKIPDSSFAQNLLFKYMSYDEQRYIKRSPSKWWSQFTLEDTLAWKRRFELQLKLTGVLNRMGVPILAGADATPESPTTLPGFSLHEELSLLVRAGLSPLQSLQAATLNPARYFGITDKLGTIKAGHWADFVILNADPLDDIENTKTIAGVVMNGRYFDRNALDEILANIVKRNSRKRPAIK